MTDFIGEYFIGPLLANGWFNPGNTIVWSVILLLGVYLVYRGIIKPLKIRIDNRFAIAIIPFIFFAAFTRVMRDYAYLASESMAAQSGNLSRFLSDIAFQYSSIQEFMLDYMSGFYPVPVFADVFSWVVALFPTPGSYILTFLFATIALAIGVIVQKYFRLAYWKVMASIGIIGTAISASMIPITNLFPLALIGGVTLLWTLIFFSWRPLFRRIRQRNIHKHVDVLLSRENQAILSAHFLDATATVVALALFGYLEQHFVPRALFPLFGPYAMFLLKIVVVPPALWLIDKYAEDSQFKTFLKIVVLILGLAPGLRNLIRLMAGV